MLDERFWSKVDKTNSCWNWTASKDREGYGKFHDRSNKIIGAHRICRICTSVYMKKHYQMKVKSTTNSVLIDSLEEKTS